MLGLTIRTAWNQKPKPQIPQGPCFHDQSEEGVQDIELNVAEINDVEVELPNVPTQQKNDLIIPCSLLYSTPIMVPPAPLNKSSIKSAL